MRTIYVPGIERHVSLAAYVAAIRVAKKYPEREFATGLTCWWPCTGREIVHQFFAGVTDRINEAIPYTTRGTERA